MFDSFLANDRAVYIIVHYKEALVWCISDLFVDVLAVDHDTRIDGIHHPAHWGIMLSCFLFSQWHRVQRWGVRRTPGAARRFETCASPSGPQARTCATSALGWPFSQRRHSRIHSARRETPYSCYRTYIRSAKERNEQRLSHVLRRRGTYKWVATQLPQLRYPLLLY